MRYRLLFKGELLAGHDPADIRHRAARRLGANAAQIERLFSGQPVILKRGLDMEAAKRYAVELRELGMRIRVEAEAPPPAASTAAAAPPAEASPPPSPELYRISFSGALVEGFTRETVMQAASDRLRPSPAQLVQLFSGQKTVLKKGLDAEQARRYASRLNAMGMRVRVEPEAASKAAAVASAAPAAAPTTPRVAEPVATPAPTPAPAPPAQVPAAPQAASPEPAAAPTPYTSTLTHIRVEPMSDFGNSQAATLVHASLLANSLEAPDMTATQVELMLTQTMVDHDLIATDQNLPDLEKTELAGAAYINQYMHDTAVTIAAPPPYVPPPYVPPPAVVPPPAPSRALPPAADPADNSAPTLISVRQCSSCGARQAHGRNCVHCGHEFPRTVHSRELEPTQLVVPDRLIPRPEDRLEVTHPVGKPGLPATRLLIPGLGLLGLVVLAIWGLTR